MKFIISYIIGITSTLNKTKILFVLYFTALIFALTAALSFKSAVSETIGSSKALLSLLKDFDYTTYSNFMNLFRGTINPLLKVAFYLGVFYTVFSIFFSGGIISSFRNRTTSLSKFWADSWTYLPRFFRLFVYVLIAEIITTLLVFFPLGAIIASISSSVQSEATFFYIIITGVIIYLFLLTILVLVSDYAKIMMVNDEAFRPFRTMLKAFGYVIKHFFSVYGLNAFFILTGLILFVIYFFFADKIGMTSGFTIFITFLLQQLFILIRLYLKISVYGGEIALVNKIGLP